MFIYLASFVVALHTRQGNQSIYMTPLACKSHSLPLWDSETLSRWPILIGLGKTPNTFFFLVYFFAFFLDYFLRIWVLF